MATIQKLSISNLRNINSLEMRPSSSLNVIYGENGSGKSSILEAVYLLGLARSFRSNQLNPLIQVGKRECTVFAELDNGVSVGISKVHRGRQVVKISGRKAENAAELAKSLPIQLINSDSFKILEASPKGRRFFMDWGVFHVEHLFIDCWRQQQRALRNRNNLLRSKASAAELDPWTVEFARYGTQIDQFRAAYVASLLPVLSEILAKLINLEGLSLEYDRGWDKQTELHEALNGSLGKDYKYGYTVLGPQRADLKIKIGQNNAVDILSRGQQKLLLSALKIAQGCLLQRETGKQCLFLVDDLPAELDVSNRLKVCTLLESLKCQIFITCVEKTELEYCWAETAQKPPEKKLFHVKHGKISETSPAL